MCYIRINIFKYRGLTHCNDLVRFNRIPSMNTCNGDLMFLVYKYFGGHLTVAIILQKTFSKLFSDITNNVEIHIIFLLNQQP